MSKSKKGNGRQERVFEVVEHGGFWTGPVHIGDRYTLSELIDEWGDTMSRAGNYPTLSDINNAFNEVYQGWSRIVWKEVKLVNKPITNTTKSNKPIVKESNLGGDFIYINDTIIYVDIECQVYGVATKHPDDEYNKEIGEALAYYRAYKGD